MAGLYSIPIFRQMMELMELMEMTAGIKIETNISHVEKILQYYSWKKKLFYIVLLNRRNDFT